MNKEAAELYLNTVPVAEMYKALIKSLHLPTAGEQVSPATEKGIGSPAGQRGKTGLQMFKEFEYRKRRFKNLDPTLPLIIIKHIQSAYK